MSNHAIVVSQSRQQNGDIVIYTAPAPDNYPPHPQQYRVLEVRPQGVICPFCGFTVTPIVTHEPSLWAWIMCIAVSILLMPFFFIGFIIGYFILVADAMQEPRYVCPMCGNYLPVTTIMI